MVWPYSYLVWRNLLEQNSSLVMPMVRLWYYSESGHFDGRLRSKLVGTNDQWVQTSRRWRGLLGSECCHLWIWFTTSVGQDYCSTFGCSWSHTIRNTCSGSGCESLLRTRRYLFSRDQRNQEGDAVEGTSVQPADFRRQRTRQSMFTRRLVIFEVVDANIP